MKNTTAKCLSNPLAGYPYQLPHHSRIAGNWGSAICRIVGANAKLRDEFAEEVRMWVFEEEVEGRKLTEIINTDHENVKYLPGRGIFASDP